MDKINCVKKINDKCLKFNEGDVEIVSSRPPVFYNTNIRYNNYLVNIRKLINNELQTECL